MLLQEDVYATSLIFKLKKKPTQPIKKAVQKEVCLPN